MDVSRCLILMMLALPSAVAYASETAQCPASIEVQEHAREVPDGWLAFEPDTKHPLMSIEFSEGVPTKRTTLLPTREKGRSISIWTFTPSAEGYWVSCSYNNTSIVISQKLPEKIIGCQVEYDEDFNPPLPKTLLCTAEGRGGGSSKGKE